MKTNKDDIRSLKNKHRLELVMQETGEVFEVDQSNAEYWLSKSTPGLTVNIRRQIYEIKFPGKDESGDVISWLKRRYSWTFGMAVKFLQKRPADPQKQGSPKSAKKTKVKIDLQGDWKTVSHIYTDPRTGSKSYAVRYHYELMDRLQKKAFETADEWILAYFSLSSKQLFGELRSFPHRFKKTVDFEIEKCASCETPFNWSSAETFGYAGEETEYLEVVSDDRELQDAYIEQPVAIDADFVICEKCLRGKYAKRYKALKLVYRSTCQREEAWRDQEQEKNACDNGAGGERTELL